MTAEATERLRERERVRSGIVYCVLVYLGVRVAVTVVAVAALGLILPLEATTDSGWHLEPATGGWHNLVTVWERFDALWFLQIADAGYVDGNGSAAFFPLFPMTVRAVSVLLGGHPLGAGLVVANLAYLGALIAVFFLTAGERGEAVARRTVLYLAIFPTAFFFLAPYSEGLFLLLAAGSLWAMRRERWWVAAGAGLLAALTRSIGLALVPALLAESWQRWRERRSWWQPVACAAAVVAGTLLYMGFWELKAGEGLAPFRQQATWQREAELPVVTLWNGTLEAFRWIGVYKGGYHLLDWLLVVPMLAAAVWVTFTARPAFTAYAWASLLVPLAFIFPARPFMSLPRFLLTIVPLFWAPAVLGQARPWLHTWWVAASAGGLALLTALFATWHYVF